MRLVQVTVSEANLDPTLDVLETEGIDYVVAAATDDPDYAATVFFPLPTEAVEPVLDTLDERGVGEPGHSVILSAESVVSESFEELQSEYEEADAVTERVAVEELRTHARDLVPALPTYVVLTVVSAVVATAGMLLGSTAIVVGAMIIAPLVGPAMATSVGSVVDDQALFRHGLGYQAGGFVLAIASASLFGAITRGLFLVPPTIDVAAVEQIAGRLTPDLLSLVVAIGSGIAGARSLSSDISTTLVGVMISAALVPPAAAVGIGVAWVRPEIVFEAGLLVVVNAVSINLAALATLWYGGVRPRDWGDESHAPVLTRWRVSALVAFVLVLSVPLGIFTASAYLTAQDRQDVRGDVRAVIDASEYSALSVLETDVGFAGGETFGLARQPDRVVVSVARPTDRTYPDLAERIQQQLRDETGVAADVRVRFVEVDRANGTPAGVSR